MSTPYAFRKSKQPADVPLARLHATVRGTMRWRVLDERGVPEVPRTPSGAAIGPAEGIVQRNLITNHGMDRMAALNALEGRSSGWVGASGIWRRRMYVGTGSTAPDVEDTALDNEVQQTNTGGEFGDGDTHWRLDTSDNVWLARSVAIRVVTMTADRNLTEWGMGQNTTNDCVIRELFRDESDTPVTISLLDGKRLLLEHTLWVEIPAPEDGTLATIDREEYDAGNNLVDTVQMDVRHGGYYHTQAANLLNTWSSSNENRTPFWAWNPSQVSGGAVHPQIQSSAYVRYAALSGSSFFGASSGVASLGGPAYVAGSYERIKRGTLSAGYESPADWYGFLVRTDYISFGHWGGWRIVLDDPSSFFKDDTETVRAGIVVSWARPGID